MLSVCGIYIAGYKTSINPQKYGIGVNMSFEIM